MPSEDVQARAQWSADATVLAQIGAVLFKEGLSVAVKLPLDLAETAIAAWERDDSGADGNQTSAEAVDRSRAGALALMGLAMSERGTPIEGAISISLDPWLIGTALDTADEVGLITPERGSND